MKSVENLKYPKPIIFFCSNKNLGQNPCFQQFSMKYAENL